MKGKTIGKLKKRWRKDLLDAQPISEQNKQKDGSDCIERIRKNRKHRIPVDAPLKREWYQYTPFDSVVPAFV